MLRSQRSGRAKGSRRKGWRKGPKGRPRVPDALRRRAEQPKVARLRQGCPALFPPAPPRALTDIVHAPHKAGEAPNSVRPSAVTVAWRAEGPRRIQSRLAQGQTRARCRLAVVRLSRASAPSHFGRLSVVLRVRGYWAGVEGFKTTGWNHRFRPFRAWAGCRIRSVPGFSRCGPGRGARLTASGLLDQANQHWDRR